VLCKVDSDDGAGLQVLAGALYRLKNWHADGGWKNVLCSHLQYARAPRFAGREEHAEIEIVREDHQPI
jgi:hypothetical protein